MTSCSCTIHLQQLETWSEWRSVIHHDQQHFHNFYFGTTNCQW